jgi:hypothetical protein
MRLVAATPLEALVVGEPGGSDGIGRVVGLLGGTAHVRLEASHLQARCNPRATRWPLLARDIRRPR